MESESFSRLRREGRRERGREGGRKGGREVSEGSFLHFFPQRGAQRRDGGGGAWGGAALRTGPRDEEYRKEVFQEDSKHSRARW